MSAPNAPTTMRSTRPNTIDVFNAGRCFDQRRPIQERPESPCENGTADDLLWRFQISQSICTSKTFTQAPHRHGHVEKENESKLSRLIWKPATVEDAGPDVMFYEVLPFRFV